MTYKKLYEDALFKLEHNKITLGEFEEMIKPLEREIEQEPCENNICDSCHTKGCIFQSGIKRVNCEFYTAQNEPCNDAISRESDELLCDYITQKILDSSPSSPVYQKVVKKGTVLDGITIVNMKALNSEYCLIQYTKQGEKA